MAMDLRELSFQNVLDSILKPAGVKVGGFPEDIFLDLTEGEVEQWTCNICYLIVKDSHECVNKHLFCHTCIFAWTLTFGENSEKCPVCRCRQDHSYKPNRQTDSCVGVKRVRCPEDDCQFVAPLKIFLMHNHGKKTFSNSHVDLESLRPAQNPALLVMPLITGGVARSERGMTIRQQLQQGRVMIHQMMLLLHMEMQLRQQALVGYTQAQDPTVRLQRLDEVLALNEQLNEVGGILSTLLNTPLNRLSSAVRDRPSRAQGAAAGGSTSGLSASTSAAAAASSTSNTARSSGLTRSLRISPATAPALDSDSDDDDDDDDDDSDSSSDPVTNVRGGLRRFGPGRNPRPSQSNTSSTPIRRTSIPRPTQPAALTADSSTATMHAEHTTTENGSLLRTGPTSSHAHATTETSPTEGAPLRPQRALVARARTPMRSLARAGDDTVTTQAANSNTTLQTTVQELGGSSTQEESSRGTVRAVPPLPRIDNNSTTTVSQPTSSVPQPPSQPAEGPDQHSSLLPSESSAHQRALRTTVRLPARSLTNTRSSPVVSIPTSQTATIVSTREALASSTRASHDSLMPSFETASRTSGATRPAPPAESTTSQRTVAPSRPLGAHPRVRPNPPRSISPQNATTAAAAASTTAPVTVPSHQDPGTFAVSPWPPMNQNSASDTVTTASTVLSASTTVRRPSGVSNNSQSVPNSVVRQRTHVQVNPRALVRARRSQPPGAGASRSRPSDAPAAGRAQHVPSSSQAQVTNTTQPSRSTNRTKARPRASTNPSRGDAGGTPGSIRGSTQQMTSILQTSGSVAAGATERRRPSQSGDVPRDGTASSEQTRPVPRARRRSEIAQEFRQFLRRDQ